MGIFGDRAAEIVAHLADDGFDFGIVHVWKGRAQIDACAFHRAQAIENRAPDEAAERRCRIQSHDAEQSDEGEEYRRLRAVAQFHAEAEGSRRLSFAHGWMPAARGASLSSRRASASGSSKTARTGRKPMPSRSTGVSRT